MSFDPIPFCLVSVTYLSYEPTFLACMNYTTDYSKQLPPSSVEMKSTFLIQVASVQSNEKYNAITAKKYDSQYTVTSCWIKPGGWKLADQDKWPGLNSVEQPMLTSPLAETKHMIRCNCWLGPYLPATFTTHLPETESRIRFPARKYLKVEPGIRLCVFTCL